MAFCNKCGTELAGGSEFCIKCGAPQAAAGKVKAQYNASPAVDVNAILLKLDTGSKVSGGGAAVAFLGFFMPVYASSSGVTMGGTAWFIPLMSLAVLGVIYYSLEQGQKNRIMLSAVQIMIGTIYASNIFRIFKGQEASLFGAGYYFITFGFIAVVIGAFMDLNKLASDRQG